MKIILTILCFTFMHLANSQDGVLIYWYDLNQSPEVAYKIEVNGKYIGKELKTNGIIKLQAVDSPINIRLIPVGFVSGYSIREINISKPEKGLMYYRCTLSNESSLTDLVCQKVDPEIAENELREIRLE